MHISELLNAYEKIVEESNHYTNGDAAERIATIYINVIFYLIEKGNLKMSDEYFNFKKYLTDYSPHDLYKVAEHYRRVKGLPPLNYEQSYYHKRGA